MRPYLKKTHHKKAGGATQGVGPEFKPQYGKQRNKNFDLNLTLYTKINSKRIILK
jgi:hypothetical protein